MHPEYSPKPCRTVLRINGIEPVGRVCPQRGKAATKTDHGCVVWTSRRFRRSFRLQLLAVAVAFALDIGVAIAADSAAPKAGAAPEGRDISWRLAGPGGGGWIQSIAWDPFDKNLLYVGCDVGGFYFSSDAGRSYEIRNQGLRDYFVESIAVHPKDSRIILLGTESGIHRTTDRGQSWHWIRSGFPATDRHRFSAPIGVVCFDPAKPNVAFAGVGRPRWDKDGQGAIYRSDDTGLTWRRVDGGQLPPRAIISDLEVKPGDSRVMLAATSKGIFRSDDEGNSWRSSNEGLPHLYTEELAFAPSSPQTVYVTLRCTAREKGAWNGSVCRSDDSGQTWRTVNGDGMPKQVGKGNNARHLSSNPKEIVVDPRDANVVYVGNRDWVSAGVYQTTDGGRRWNRVARHTRDSLNMDYGWITQWGPHVECLGLSPAVPDQIVFGTSGHVFVSNNAGKSWQQRYTREQPDGRIAGTGLEVTCAWRVLPDPVRPNRLYFCYMDIGLLISDDQGRTFRRSQKGMKMGGNCFGVVVDRRQPQTLWAATGWWGRNEGDICRSDDDGQTWRVVGESATGLPTAQVLELVLDLKSPEGQRRLLAASNGNGIYETRDDGKTWQSINGNLPPEAVTQPRGLLLDPANSDHVVVAVGRNIHETRDRGKTWQRLNAADVFGDIKHLAANPHDFATLYVAVREHYDPKARRLYSGGAFRSDDAGRTWRQILDFRFAHCIAVSPADPRILYVATADHPYHDDPLAEGLLKSTDGGTTWRRENTGLSHHNIKAVTVSPHDPSAIFVSISGNSAYVGHDAAVRTQSNRPARTSPGSNP